MKSDGKIDGLVETDPVTEEKAYHLKNDSLDPVTEEESYHLKHDALDPVTEEAGDVQLNKSLNQTLSEGEVNWSELNGAKNC